VLRSFVIEAGALRPLAPGADVATVDGAVWLDLVAPTAEEERALEQAMGIDIPTRAEVSGIQTSDRLVVRAGTLYMSAFVPAGIQTASTTVPVTFVRTDDRLITIRYTSVESLDDFIIRFSREEAGLGGAGDLFAALLETIVDRIAERLEQVGDALKKLSRGIFHHPSAVARRAGRHIPRLKRTHRLEAVIEDIGTQHEIASRMRECLLSLIRLVAFSDEHAEDGLHHRLMAIGADLRSVAEHNTHLAADMEFMLDATVGLIDIQQNKVIYILSIVSVVLTPPVLVASVYGMNFEHMPELTWPYGYAWALGLMLLSGIGPYLIFKLRGWL
jgi:magnesium transporter